MSISKHHNLNKGRIYLTNMFLTEILTILISKFYLCLLKWNTSYMLAVSARKEK